ncbi:serine/threonine-protein kinase haspin homolog [Euwallacea similis]|uniref:serine/threonine-protein kinase haspin homolog n=1 Tax=Euwallacea similis TaxID=1736056 RepID=UPI00344DD951
MQLLNKDQQLPKEICMFNYESLSGYVENSLRPKVLSDYLEDCFGCSSIINSKNNQGSVYQHLLSFIKTHFVISEYPQVHPAYFQECYPKSLTQNCHKVGEGLYGEVFLFRDPSGGTTVMKVIPIEGTQTVNGECQKKLKEAFPELLIATELSDLRCNRINQTSSFIEVKNIRCVQGRYPEELLELWNLYKESRGSINDSPEIFTDNQLYLILETSYGGCDMESFIFDNAAQAFSLFLQVAFALAVAEEELQFEHRDLHWGNILLSRIPTDEKITFKLEGKEIKIGSYGIKATIIDFTMSRITAHDVDISTDLGKDCGIFKGSHDYQFEVYQLMRSKNGNEWSHFEPFSNILWLSYILDKTITALNYTDTTSKLHKKYLNKLKELNLEVLGYDSVKGFVRDMFSNK